MSVYVMGPPQRAPRSYLPRARRVEDRLPPLLPGPVGLVDLQEPMHSFCAFTTSSIVARGSRWKDSWRSRFVWAAAVGEAARTLAMTDRSVRSRSAAAHTQLTRP